MDDDYRYRVNYSENVAPKYPTLQDQGGLEVVPNDSPLYPAPIHVAGDEKWPRASRGWTDAPILATEDRKDGEKRRILGLTVPLFWLILVIIAIILAGGIGGGIGGGLKAQQKSNINASRSVTPN